MGVLGRAVERADQMRAPFEAVRARRLLATALAATGVDVAEVTDLVAAATEIAASHGFEGERALLAQLLASHSAGPPELTASELRSNS